nr:hypothetical protein [Bacteroidota bacterium]
MNINLENTGELTATLKMEVVESDYAGQLDAELKSHRQKAAMPGFRPGKVPMGIIKKKYGVAILAEEVNKVISTALNNYIAEQKLDLLGYPIPNTEQGSLPDFVHNKDFTFNFNIGFAPKLEPELTKDFDAEYYKIGISDDETDKFIENIRQRNGKNEEYEEVSQGSLIDVSILELDSDHKIIEGGITNNTSILLHLIKDEDIRKQFIGSKVGDIIIFNPLKATESDVETGTMLGIKPEEAKLLENDFQFEITKISGMIPAELDTDLFYIAFPGEEIDDLESFRKRVKEEGSKAYAVEADKFFLKQTIDNLIEKANIQLPDEFLKKWLFVSNEGKLSSEEIEKNYSHYQVSMKHELFESKLIQNNDQLRITDQDIKNEIKKYFGNYIPPTEGEDPETRNQSLEGIATRFLENKEETRKIHDQLFDQRLTALLKSKLKVTEKTIPYDEFIELIQKSYPQPHNHDHEHDHEHNHAEEGDEQNSQDTVS